MRIYLLASFPSLAFHDPSPISMEELFTRCAAHLSENDMTELEAVCSQSDAGTSPFAKTWSEACSEFSTINVMERTNRLPRDAATEKMPEPAGRHDQLRNDTLAAWEESDPLKRETRLLQSKWTWLEDRRRTNPYSLDDLLGYALQLQLLERKNLWEEDQGTEQFNVHTQAFLEPVLEELRKQDLPV